VATIAHGAGIAGLPAGPAAQATAEGSLLAAYRFADYRRDPDAAPAVSEVSIVEFDGSKIAAMAGGVAAARAIAQGVYLCRDLVNMPPNVATPERMAQAAVDIARAHGLTAELGDRTWAAEQGMGAFLAVAMGAGDDPRFVILKHNEQRDDLPTLVLVGKGITFDTGGISLKGREGMGAMKGDMGGAAAVLGAMKVVGLLNLPLRVIGLAPCTENKPDAHAYRPSDVITAGNKKTIEIISTDAEGRMVLADALVYASRFAPDAVIDLATLTGAVSVALGRGVAAALYGNDDALRERLLAAGAATYERLWAMPLWDDYREAIRSPVADMKNSGGRDGGLGSSAMFLYQFVDYPWAHLDIAGVAMAEKEGAYAPAGATGFGVRLLVELLRHWSH
jgi:leucyl aminopeptidase